jgi:ornithine cyclodeaminase
MSAALDLAIVPVNEPKGVIECADIVLAATNTNVPVFNGAWLREGTHVTSIVGSNVGMVQAGVITQKRRELDDETLKRAAVIGIASRQLAIQDQQGDIYDQVEASQLSWDAVVELREIVSGQKQGRRRAADITVFKNNGGQGVAELAIADLILTRAREKKLGVEITWGEGY